MSESRMSKATEEWEELLRGTAAGPWRASLLADGVEHEDGSSNYRGGIYPEGQGSPPILLTNGMDKRDAKLIAAAPEAVAEVLRLRRAFAEWASRLDTLVEELDEKGYRLNAEQLSATIAGIRFILEGK